MIMAALHHFGRLSSLISHNTSHISAVFRSCKQSSTLASLKEILGSEIAAIRTSGTFKHERVITSAQSSNITVLEREGGLLNFCANNYLGLSVRINSLLFILNRR